jgi:hypothetical protein
LPTIPFIFPAWNRTLIEMPSDDTPTMIKTVGDDEGATGISKGVGTRQSFVILTTSLALMLVFQFSSFQANVIISEISISFDTILSSAAAANGTETLLDLEGVASQNTTTSSNFSTASSRLVPEVRENTTNPPKNLNTSDISYSEDGAPPSVVQKPPLECRLEAISTRTSKIQEFCCAEWDISSDDWWLNRPDWEVSSENDTHYCFSPIEDSAKASYLRYLHTRQSNDVNCTDLEKSVEINSGYGASTTYLTKAFWHALKKTNKPFQIVHNSRRWLYATANRSSWAYCDEEDSRCYYLPINPCNRTFYNTMYAHSEMLPPNKQAKLQLRLEYYWMTRYTFRRKHEFRRQLYQFRKAYQLDHITAPCLTMHVRRGDAGLMRPPFRRYAAVQEYLDAVPNLAPNETIFLMTDDQSTIEEVQQYHAHKYNWRYVDRPRVHSISGGFDGHIPSGDPAFEMLVLDTELTVATRCDRFVYGNSGFVKGMLESLDLENKTYSSYVVHTTVTKEEVQKFPNKQARVEALMMDIAATYRNMSSPTASKEMPKRRRLHPK